MCRPAARLSVLVGKKDPHRTAGAIQVALPDRGPWDRDLAPDQGSVFLDRLILSGRAPIERKPITPNFWDKQSIRKAA